MRQKIKDTVNACYKLFTGLLCHHYTSAVWTNALQTTCLYMQQLLSVSNMHLAQQSWEKRAVSPHWSLQGGVQINESIVSQLFQWWRFPTVTRRWTQNHSWAQDAFGSPTQCEVMSIPAVPLSKKWTWEQTVPDTSLSQLAIQISHREMQNVSS